ncbi:MAG TPA: fibronectin type III domain-containing protein [Deltaproteobacteria bacterium]|nr:fibronectin type III domain-containing protein [Deltaproteobacteria bacterium]HQA70150.1 fibronectin type III domain-containing protein [Deltaproteobacteria bacterium]
MRNADKVILIIISFLILSPAMGFAASVVVSWNANTESDLAGYIVYYGTRSGNYTASVDTGNVTRYQFNNVQTGVTYYVAVSAYDTSGNESELSDEASIYVSSSPTQVKPTISLLSPQNGARVSSNPLFSWSGSGMVRYKVLASLDNRTYYTIYTGSGTSCRLSSSNWNGAIRSGARVYWYVQGTASDGKVYKSSVFTFRKR